VRLLEHLVNADTQLLSDVEGKLAQLNKAQSAIRGKLRDLQQKILDLHSKLYLKMDLITRTQIAERHVVRCCSISRERDRPRARLPFCGRLRLASSLLKLSLFSFQCITAI
jgi:hypothetical protein